MGAGEIMVKYTPRTFVREMLEESPDLKRLRKWVEENVDLTKARSIEHGRDIIRRAVDPGPRGEGARLMIEEGLFDDMFFAAKVPEFVEHKKPKRKVKDIREWRELTERRLTRVHALGRLKGELLAFSVAADKPRVVKRLARKWKRSPVTLAADLAALRAVGWIKKVAPRTYLLTDEGRRIVEEWT
jgi:hypothetical protein